MATSKINSKDFVAKPGRKINLAEWPTRVGPCYDSKHSYEKMIEKNGEKIGSLQEVLYASNQYALLLILQGMDTAGKDGAISHVLSGVNPQGFEVSSFKTPSAEELDHDFLWRTSKRLPERGRIGIFNRSYYEEVLVVRVHPEYLTPQNLPKKLRGGDDFWEKRYQSIKDHEHHLLRNGTQVIKIFLHLSKEEQRQRLLARIDQPEKNWKFSLGDVEERKLWDKYMQAYQECISGTSTAEAPWYIIPADDKKNARLLVGDLIASSLKDLNLKYPKPDEVKRAELVEVARQLKAQAKRES